MSGEEAMDAPRAHTLRIRLGPEAEARLEELGRFMAAARFGREEDQEAWNTLKQRLERMEQQILRAGREQFRGNTLTEATQARLETVLGALRALDEDRGRQLEQARDALHGARTEGRVAFFTRFLPALDSLDEALAAGSRQLAGWVDTEGEPLGESGLSLGTRLRYAWRLLRSGSLPEERLRRESLAGWLKGLELLRERLLEHFAEEGIRPMATLGEPFDPHLHLAFGTAPPDPGHPAGTIVREARPGYLLGETVLRYAEVVVAR